MSPAEVASMTRGAVCASTGDDSMNAAVSSKAARREVDGMFKNDSLSWNSQKRESAC